MNKPSTSSVNAASPAQTTKPDSVKPVKTEEKKTTAKPVKGKTEAKGPLPPPKVKALAAGNALPKGEEPPLTRKQRKQREAAEKPRKPAKSVIAQEPKVAPFSAAQVAFILAQVRNPSSTGMSYAKAVLPPAPDDAPRGPGKRARRREKRELLQKSSEEEPIKGPVPTPRTPQPPAGPPPVRPASATSAPPSPEAAPGDRVSSGSRRPSSAGTVGSVFAEHYKACEQSIAAYPGCITYGNPGLLTLYHCAKVQVNALACSTEETDALSQGGVCAGASCPSCSENTPVLLTCASVLTLKQITSLCDGTREVYAILPSKGIDIAGAGDMAVLKIGNDSISIPKTPLLTKGDAIPVGVLQGKLTIVVLRDFGAFRLAELARKRSLKGALIEPPCMELTRDGLSFTGPHGPVAKEAVEAAQHRMLGRPLTMDTLNSGMAYVARLLRDDGVPNAPQMAENAASVAFLQLQERRATSHWWVSVRQYFFAPSWLEPGERAFYVRSLVMVLTLLSSVVLAHHLGFDRSFVEQKTFALFDAVKEAVWPPPPPLAPWAADTISFLQQAGALAKIISTFVVIYFATMSKAGQVFAGVWLLHVSASTAWDLVPEWYDPFQGQLLPVLYGIVVPVIGAVVALSFLPCLRLFDWMAEKANQFSGHRAGADPRPGAQGHNPPLQIVAGSILDNPTSLYLVVIEEVVKRQHWSLAVGLVCFEAARAYKREQFTLYVPTAWMHWVSFLVPLPLGIIVHAVWNNFAMPGSLLEDNVTSAWMRDVDAGKTELHGLCPDELGDDWRRPCECTIVFPSDVTCVPSIKCWLMGLGVLGHQPKVYAQCVHAEAEAIRKRVGVKTLYHENPDRVHHFWRQHGLQNPGNKTGDFWDAIDDAQHFYVPLAFTEWLHLWPMGLRIRLRAARVLLDRHGLVKSDYLVKAFVKLETTTSNPVTGVFKRSAPRLIQGRSDAVKAATGPFFRGVGKALARHFGIDRQVCYASGKSAEEVSIWFNACVADGFVPFTADGEKWDCATSPPALAALEPIYAEFKPPHVVKQFLASRQKPIHGMTNRGIRFSRTGGVCSGDGDTSVGNTTIHAMIWYAIAKENSWDSDQLRVIIAGDDSLAFVRPDMLARLRTVSIETFARAGYKLVETLCSIDTARFCSGRFWEILPGQYKFGPSPGRVLSKLMWSTTKYGPMARRRWLRGTALSMENSAAHVPVLAFFISMTLNLTEGIRRPIFPKLWEERIKADSKTAMTKYTERHFARIYGVKESDLSLIAFTIRSRGLHPSLWDLEPLTQMCRVDDEQLGFESDWLTA